MWYYLVTGLKESKIFHHTPLPPYHLFFFISSCLSVLPPGMLSSRTPLYLLMHPNKSEASNPFEQNQSSLSVSEAAPILGMNSGWLPIYHRSGMTINKSHKFTSCNRSTKRREASAEAWNLFLIIICKSTKRLFAASTNARRSSWKEDRIDKVHWHRASLEVHALAASRGPPARSGLLPQFRLIDSVLMSPACNFLYSASLISSFPDLCGSWSCSKSACYNPENLGI
jgi:hypothetical protein